MKTMTCQDLGGPCEFVHRGDSADDIIKAQDQHLKDVVKGGDDAHVPAEAVRGPAGGLTAICLDPRRRTPVVRAGRAPV
ncbi:hypothetical protein BOH72_01615 [Mycobacterium sp. WY10]|nr:hypothetical protein BOH72_01615 [Mycobacterium sp. WY10]